MGFRVCLICVPNGYAVSMTTYPTISSLLIRANGTTEIISRDLNDPDGYKVISTLVADGGPFDIVTARDNYTIYVDDEGLLKGSPTNNFASLITNRIIVGDVLLCGEVDDEGNDTTLPIQLLGLDFSILSDITNSEINDELEQIRSAMDLTPQVIPMTDKDFAEYLGVE